MRIALSHALLACLLACATNSVQAQSSLEPGTDRAGSDYQGFPLRSADPAACQRRCDDDSACRAYTYVNPGVQGPQAMCYLKSSVPAASANACCTSGVKPTARRPITMLRAAPLPTPPPPPGIRAPRKAAEQAEALFIPAPRAVTVTPDFNKHFIQWQWTAQGCFPQAAGSKPVPCPYVQDIEGFKLFNGQGGLEKIITDPKLREVSVGAAGKACYLLVAFRGTLESAASAPVCSDANTGPVYGLDPSLPAPGNLRLAQSAAECASAGGGGLFLGNFCQAALDHNDQVLIWDWSGSGIEGFRIYDRRDGSAVVVETRNIPKQHAYFVPALKNGIWVNDGCFSVRAWRGDKESASSNVVCLNPKAPPVIPDIVLTPARGLILQGLQLRKNQNSGCPFEEKHLEFRNKLPYEGALPVTWLHKDTNILCGDRKTVWYQPNVEFDLTGVPAKISRATLKFESQGSYAKVGTEPGFLNQFGNDLTPGVDCLLALYAYRGTLASNTSDPIRQGDPLGWFDFLNKDLLAIDLDNTPGATNSIDVTKRLKKDLAGGKKTLGFVWAVDFDLHADNDMCTSNFRSVRLEITPAP